MNSKCTSGFRLDFLLSQAWQNTRCAIWYYQTNSTRKPLKTDLGNRRKRTLKTDKETDPCPFLSLFQRRWSPSLLREKGSFFLNRRKHHLNCTLKHSYPEANTYQSCWSNSRRQVHDALSSSWAMGRYRILIEHRRQVHVAHSSSWALFRYRLDWILDCWITKCAAKYKRKRPGLIEAVKQSLGRDARINTRCEVKQQKRWRLGEESLWT